MLQRTGSTLLGLGALASGALDSKALAEIAEAPGVDLGPGQPFSFDILKEMARTLAQSPWKKSEPVAAGTLQKIDYDAYQQIRYRADKSLKLTDAGATPVQLFHLGKYFMEPVRMHIVDNGSARLVKYTPELFDMPKDHVARTLPAELGFAGFRVMAPDLKTDWYAALGASYFRTSGPFNQYGLSARGLAIDTAMPTPEEFPRFSEYWLEGSVAGGATLTIYGLLDSPSCTGAYRMRTTRSTDSRGVHSIVMDIDCELNARKTIRRLGIAPFSSMYWYGENSRSQAIDWRPEIHDSDGLAILTGSGERIWRPLNNPRRVMTSAFVDHDPKGFGLLQRDRDFVHYLDDGVFYERRSSVWVEPMSGWGAGSVQLVEIPTDDETSDNIVAYWCPEQPFLGGERRQYSYRLSWLDDIPFPDTLGRATATWSGIGGRPGQARPAGVRKFVIDFQGPVFDGLDRTSGVDLVITTSRGTVSNVYSHPVVDQKERWRAFFDVQATGADPVDMRAFLRLKNKALTETWIYQYFPEG